MIDVVIPTIKGREEKLAKLIESIPKECNVIVVDDEDKSLSQKRNKGSRMGKSEFILFIDDDNVLGSRTIKYALDVFRDTTVGIVGMIACYADDVCKIADSGSHRHLLSGITWDRYVNQTIWELVGIPPYEVNEVANAFMVRRSLFEALGEFDSETFPTEMDEADLCKRAKWQEFKTMISPKPIVYHCSQTYSRIPDLSSS